MSLSDSHFSADTAAAAAEPAPGKKKEKEEKKKTADELTALAATVQNAIDGGTFPDGCIQEEMKEWLNVNGGPHKGTKCSTKAKYIALINQRIQELNTGRKRNASEEDGAEGEEDGEGDASMENKDATAAAAVKRKKVDDSRAATAAATSASQEEGESQPGSMEYDSRHKPKIVWSAEKQALFDRFAEYKKWSQFTEDGCAYWRHVDTGEVLCVLGCDHFLGPASVEDRAAYQADPIACQAAASSKR